MINLDDIKYYIKNNISTLTTEFTYKNIYDYNFHIQGNNVIIYLYLKQHKYGGGTVNWNKILTIKISKITSYIRTEKLQKIKI